MVIKNVQEKGCVLEVGDIISGTPGITVLKAVMVDTDLQVVLAFSPTKKEFIVWMYSVGRGLFSGFYSPDLKEALDHFDFLRKKS